MMTRAANISTPESEKLSHWKAMSDAAAAHKFFQDNPKVIDQLAAKIAGAYALSAAERKERDDAVDIAELAKKEIKDALAAKKQAEDDALKIKKEADNYAKEVRLSADSYRKAIITEVSADRKNMEDEEKKISEKLEDLNAKALRLKSDEDTVVNGLREIEEWRKEKEEWEQDYANRSARLDAKLRKAVRG